MKYVLFGKLTLNENQEITISPCKHAFTKGALENWLENEKAECPICRFKFDAKEVRINPEKPEENEEDGDEGSGTEGDNGEENEGENDEEHEGEDSNEENMDVDEQLEDGEEVQ